MSVEKTTVVMKGISVEFPGVRALKGVDYTFESGRVTALVGANGAGKSTLMKVLSGLYTHYTGSIEINGEPVEIRSVNTARALGFETVFQEVDTALVHDLTVAENIMMDYLVSGLGKKHVVNWKHIYRTSEELLDRLGLSLPLREVVGRLSLAQKQMVVIARAVLRDCRFLILDEPTAPLSEAETEKLFDIVRTLKDNGVGVIFISHRLNELFEICESLSVLRDGNMIVSNKVLGPDVTIADIVGYMIGDAFNSDLEKDDRKIGDVLFEAKNVSDRFGHVKDISLYARAGEIVGISGLVGAGKTELCKALFGAYGRLKSGKMLINGKELSIKNPGDAVKAGLALVPEERRKEGIILGETVNTNLSLSTLEKHTGVLATVNRSSEKTAAREKVEKLGIATAGIEQIIDFLSGGNQQKVTIGKWIDSDADVYLLDEVTKGIDVGAKQDVYRLVVELAKQGKAILFSSSEQSEILQLTDRVYVMYDGMIRKEFITEEATEEQLLLHSTGGTEE